jgi:hypothetical protein
MQDGFGISKGTYSSTIDQPTHGPGQGADKVRSVDGSQLPLFTAMYEQCLAYRFAIRK